MPVDQKKGTDEPELLPAYSFEVYFGNQVKIGFSRVSNLSFGQGINTILDGGKRGEYSMLRKSDRERRHRRLDTIVMERGVGTGADDEVIRELVSGVHLKNIMIKMLLQGKPVRMFAIDEGMITRCSFSDLDALRSEVLIRRLEIRHTGIEEVTV